MTTEMPDIGRRSLPQMADSVKLAIRILDGSGSKPRPSECMEHITRLRACLELLERIDPTKFKEPY